MLQVTAYKCPHIAQSRRRSFAVAADDGHYYWVALPKADRVSAYKAFATQIAKSCGIRCGEPAKIFVGGELVNEIRKLCAHGEEIASLDTGLYYGSKYPADPTVHAIYDFLPESLVASVRNRSEFSVMRAISLWLGDSMSPHAVYVRQPERDFLACMVGFGQAFRFNEPARRLFPIERALLETDDTWDQIGSGVDQINRLDERHLRKLAKEIPPKWWEGADRSASHIVDQLLHRRVHLPSMLAAIGAKSPSTPLRKTVHCAVAAAGKMSDVA